MFYVCGRLRLAACLKLLGVLLMNLGHGGKVWFCLGKEVKRLNMSYLFSYKGCSKPGFRTLTRCEQNFLQAKQCGGKAR